MKLFRLKRRLRGERGQSLRIGVEFVRPSRWKRSSGQALIETAFLIPFLLMIVFNAINFGYFYYVALNMSAATRTGSLYSIIGPETPVKIDFAPAGDTSTTTSISYSMYQDMRGALPSAANKAAVQVCSQSVGVTGTADAGTLKATCQSFVPSGLSYSFDAADVPPVDPEVVATSFIAHRVDIAYKFEPLVPGTPFGAILLATPICSLSSGSISCTFHQKVIMRAM